MKILFVDDEPRILSGIRRMLFHLEHWDITCVESGYAALEVLAAEHFDVVVTDMRMPGMDGAALLQEVYVRHPDLVRIVFSGYSELEAVLRTVPVAHQFLTKPCKPGLLEEVVERACSLHALLSDEAVRQIVGKVDKLPSVPWVFSQLTVALLSPDTDATVVGDIISQDLAMCAKVLQLVNSSFFFRRVPCTDVHQAVVRLGFQMIKNLVLSVEVFRTENDFQCEGFTLTDLQSHSLKVASLAGSYLSDPREAEDAFMAGMLHDIGKLVLASELPSHLEEVLALTAADGLSFAQAELETLGVTHAEIGGYLMGLWGLPYPIVEAVANHHAPERVPRHEGFGVLEAVVQANEASSLACGNSGALGGLAPLWKLASDAPQQQREDRR